MKSALMSIIFFGNVAMSPAIPARVSQYERPKSEVVEPIEVNIIGIFESEALDGTVILEVEACGKTFEFPFPKKDMQSEEKMLKLIDKVEDRIRKECGKGSK